LLTTYDTTHPVLTTSGCYRKSILGQVNGNALIPGEKNPHFF